jgi:peptidoglycan-N-acetylglucosamine deacetylase
MLNPHRISCILFIFALIIAYLYLKLSLAFYVVAGGLFFTFLLVEFLGAYLIRWNFHLKSQNSLDNNSGKIALTFDDGPTDPQTTKVLDTLKKHEVKATFFVIGKNIKGKESILKRMVEEGHSIGSHSYSHDFWIDLWGKSKLEADIRKSLETIKSVTGKEVKLFRPPYGVTTPKFSYVIKKLGLRCIGWNMRSYDTTTSDINKILESVLSKTRQGSIILLHDRLDHMAQLLDELIPKLKQKNFEFVRIE